MPGLYALIVTEADGNTITAAKRNAEHTNHITNQTPQMTDDYSANAAQMQTTADPGESGSESLATSLAGEIERLRFAINELKGKTYWYQTGSTNIESIFNLTSVSTMTLGMVTNLGISYSAGTLSVVQASGSALSATAFGAICVPSTTAGQSVILKATAPASFNDDAHANSDLTNLGFGVTETVAWAQDVPYFLYVVNRGNAAIDGTDGNSAFFISRSPCMSTTPSSANDIGDTAAIPSNDSQNVILLLGDYTIANYVSLPCQVIGAFRMRWSTSTDDWTVQALGNSDGVGVAQLEKTFATEWTFPTGQNGAASGTHIHANGGTAPIFSTNVYYYKISRNGLCSVRVAIDGDGGTDGSGVVDTRMSLPYSSLTTAYKVTAGSVNSVGEGNCTCSFDFASGNAYVTLYRNTNTGSLFGVMVNSNFSNGARQIGAIMEYRAF